MAVQVTIQPIRKGREDAKKCSRKGLPHHLAMVIIGKTD